LKVYGLAYSEITKLFGEAVHFGVMKEVVPAVLGSFNKSEAFVQTTDATFHPPVFPNLS
jgi:hypothetical protein